MKNVHGFSIIVFVEVRETDAPGAISGLTVVFSRHCCQQEGSDLWHFSDKQKLQDLLEHNSVTTTMLRFCEDRRACRNTLRLS